MTKEEEKYTTLDIDQCKWWVNHLFSIAKEQACNSHNFDDAEEIQAAQDKILKALEQPTSPEKVSLWKEEKKKADEEIKVGDICRYKGYTDRFMITSIELGKYFDGVYESGKTINDGTLSLVERVGHYNKLEDFLNWIREDKDNE